MVFDTKKYIITCIILLLNTYDSISAPIDAIPPTYTWVSPTPYCLLTTSTVRLCVEAHDNENGSGIEKVSFYVGYNISLKHHYPREFIGDVSTFPYELIWDCTNITDQRATLYCEVTDSAGNITNTDSDGNYYLCVIIDRSQKLKTDTVASYKTVEVITIDGKLNEWAPKDSIIFKNNDNEILIYSLWNKINLYIGVVVNDISIISTPNKKDNNYKQILTEDSIEIYLDTDHDHCELSALPDRHFILSPGDISYEKIRIFDGFSITTTTNFDINCGAEIQGTLNKEDDFDQCYSIELAIPWDSLDVHPENGVSMGLNIWNNDKDYIDGTHYYGSWCSNIIDMKNSSEWGDIVFIDDSTLFYKVAFAAGIFLIGAILFIVYGKNRLGGLVFNNASEIVERDQIKSAKEYIEKHYANENLSREEVAKHVGMNQDYFSRIFKEETGLTFTDYLTLKRIESAKRLLLKTRKNIAEIAYEIGFSSQSYFGTKFKKLAKRTPREFRNKSVKRAR